MEQHKMRFIAKDKDGKEYIIDQYVTIRDVSTYQEPNATIETLKRFETNGENVNWVRKGEYKLLDGTLLFSDDPDAP